MRLAFIVVSLAIIGVESLGYRKRIKKIIPSNQENYVYRHHQTSNLAQQHRGIYLLFILIWYIPWVTFFFGKKIFGRGLHLTSKRCVKLKCAQLFWGHFTTKNKILCEMCNIFPLSIFANLFAHQTTWRLPYSRYIQQVSTMVAWMY